MAKVFTQMRKDISKLYNRPNDLQVYVYLRNEANYGDSFFNSGGFSVRKDEAVRSYNTIANATGLTVPMVRSSIKHLINEGFITQSHKGKYSLFSTACEFANNAAQHNHTHNYQQEIEQHKYKNIK